MMKFSIPKWWPGIPYRHLINVSASRWLPRQPRRSRSKPLGRPTRLGRPWRWVNQLHLTMPPFGEAGPEHRAAHAHGYVERQAQLLAVRAALIEGEESGVPPSFDVQASKARMAAAVHG